MESVQTIRVAIDVGSEYHWVGIGLSDGTLLEEFEIRHEQSGFHDFFRRVEVHRRRLRRPVVVAMEGYNGWARPLDSQIQQRGYTLFNVNNLKLARYKEIFPAAAKTEQIDARKMLELFHLRESLPLAKEVLQEVKERPDENQRLKRLTRRRRQLGAGKGSGGVPVAIGFTGGLPRIGWHHTFCCQLLVSAFPNFAQGSEAAGSNAPFRCVETQRHRSSLRRDYPKLAESCSVLARSRVGG